MYENLTSVKRLSLHRGNGKNFWLDGRRLLVFSKMQCFILNESSWSFNRFLNFLCIFKIYIYIFIDSFLVFRSLYLTHFLLISCSIDRNKITRFYIDCILGL